MKLNNSKWLYLKPLLVGVVGILAGIGLVLYYLFYAENATTASYVMSGILMLAGLIAVLSTIYFAIDQKLKNKVLNEGEGIIAEYVSNACKASAAKTNYYCITYRYTKDSLDCMKTSKNEFTWQEVLTLKAVEKFSIKVLNNKVVLNCDLDKMFNENKEKIAEIEKKYNDAYKAVDIIINSK